ncbi:MAG TPA: Gfo/Idh/MocA family oxidoreductase [Gaiellales bacterium]|jgi:predicted dehydrogenase|nr:Gfo/Idh/MocA family oxidoreductase [Gaiellales bacterium]
MRIGLVGAGAVARHHLTALQDHPEAEVGAVGDLDRGRAERVAAETGARAYTDWGEMLERERLDAVLVCTPPAAHAAPVLAAFERGLDVYLEKPLARSLADGERIVAAWQAAGTVCAVGYQWRSLDLVDRLRAELAGAASMLVSRSIGPTEPGRGDGSSWFADPEASGGILFELGSHDIDLQCALSGPVAEVHAISARGVLAPPGTRGAGLDDAVGVVMRFAGGGLGMLALAWSDVQRPPVYALDVLSPEVSLHIDLDPAFRLHGRAHGADVDVPAAVDPRRASIARFLEAAGGAGQGRVPCSPADALETLRAALAAETAIATGRPVEVGED